jgi:hypothetical protein
MCGNSGRHLVILALLLPLVVPATARAEDPPKPPDGDASNMGGEIKKAGREFVQDVKTVGRDVRKSKVGRYVEGGARDVARDAAGAGRSGLAWTKSTTFAAADEVRRATREFWDDVIRTRRAVLDKLRKENSDLEAGNKEKKEGEAPRTEPAREVR